MSKRATVADATNVLRARIARNAFLHIEKLDVRAGSILEEAGLFVKTSDQPIPPELSDVIADASHPRRIVTKPGPIVFHKNEGEPGKQFALDMRPLLLNSDSRIRAAALSHFLNLSKQTSPWLSTYTARVLGEKQGQFLDGSEGWLSAALAVHEAVDSDFLCQVAGCRQSMHERYEDGLREFVPKVLRPQLHALEALEIAFLNPSEQQQEIKVRIDELSVQEDLGIALDTYLESLGILPLTNELSFVALVDSWEKRHPNKSAADSLAKWVSGATPPALFYAALWFLGKPDRLPDSLKDVLAPALTEMLEFRGGEDEDLSVKPAGFWAVYEGLAQHYLRFLESHAPGAIGEPLAIGAWWMARKVSLALLENSRAMAHLHDIAILPQARQSSLSSVFANVPGPRGAAALATHWQTSPWKLAILANVNEESADALLKWLSVLQPEEDLAHNVVRNFTFWSPAKQSSKNSTFLFQRNLHDAIAPWTSALGNSPYGQHLATMADYYSQYAQPAKFLEKLEKASDLDDAEQLILANSARLLAYQEIFPIDEAWERLADSQWRNGLFQRLTPLALEMLFLALAYSVNRASERRVAELPHLFAHSCEASGEDKNRADQLFMYTIVSCIHTYSVSALERLLAGKNRTSVLQSAREWRSQLLQASRLSPPWIAARLRALTAAMSAAL